MGEQETLLDPPGMAEVVHSSFLLDIDTLTQFIYLQMVLYSPLAIACALPRSSWGTSQQMISIESFKKEGACP